MWDEFHFFGIDIITYFVLPPRFGCCWEGLDHCHFAILKKHIKEQHCKARIEIFGHKWLRYKNIEREIFWQLRRYLRMSRQFEKPAHCVRKSPQKSLIICTQIPLAKKVHFG